MQSVRLQDIRLTGNYLLVKPDPDYEFIELDGGKKLWVAYMPQDAPRYMAISGSVVKTPGVLKYHGEVISRGRRGPGYVCQDEMPSLIRSSLEFDTDLMVRAGDKVYFNYTNQLMAIEEDKIIDVEGRGKCMLVKYDTLYGYVRGCPCHGITPLNGYVFFNRDQVDFTGTTGAGVHYYQKATAYTSNYGTVLRAAPAIREYLDGQSYDDPVDLKEGDRIFVQPNFGYRLLYDLVAGDLKGVEVVRRAHIMAKLN